MLYCDRLPEVSSHFCESLCDSPQQAIKMLLMQPEVGLEAVIALVQFLNEPKLSSCFSPLGYSEPTPS